MPLGATLVGVGSKPDLTEPNLDLEEKLQEVDNNSKGVFESKEELQKYFKDMERRAKQNRPKNPAQFQLAGEMLAAALHNYQNQPRKTAHTIFGLWIVGMHCNVILALLNFIIGS